MVPASVRLESLTYQRTGRPGCGKPGPPRTRCRANGGSRAARILSTLNGGENPFAAWSHSPASPTPRDNNFHTFERFTGVRTLSHLRTISHVHTSLATPPTAIR